MAGYISTIYDEKVRPYTEYPFQLCKYLLHRFNMKEGYKLLDVGCGRGDFLTGFKDSGLEVYGLDSEEYHSQISRGIEVRYADIENEFTVGFNFGAGLDLGRLGLYVRYERGFNENEATFIENNTTSYRLDSRPEQIIFSLSYRLSGGK